MTATNHALTGAIIGLTISQPFIAIPVAFLSHFVLDAIPHYKSSRSEEEILSSNIFRNYLIVEALICFMVVLVLVIFSPGYWIIPAVCAFLATSPDLYSAKKYFANLQGKSWTPTLYSKFAGGIQWFERPIGAVVEIFWLFAAIWILVNLL